jgi:Zn-dependent protease
MIHALTIAGIAIVSIWLHELGHAFASHYVDYDRLGSRRWAFNPLVNLDPVLSIILPLAASLVSGGGLCIGVGRPFLLSKAGGFRILFAGPFVNLLLMNTALVLGWEDLFRVNAALLAVNLLPVKPMDGWAILHNWREKRLLRAIAIERLQRETHKQIIRDMTPPIDFDGTLLGKE